MLHCSLPRETRGFVLRSLPRDARITILSMFAQQSQNLEFDEALIRRYDQSGPRYTSYPTAVQFQESFTPKLYRDRARQTNRVENPRPLSLYFHIPFCDTVCF